MAPVTFIADFAVMVVVPTIFTSVGPVGTGLLSVTADKPKLPVGGYVEVAVAVTVADITMIGAHAEHVDVTVKALGQPVTPVAIVDLA